MIRFGLCCQFSEQKIKFRTATAKHLKTLQNPLEKLSNIILANAQSLLASIEYCASHRIGSFRIGSGLFPLYTHPDIPYELKDLQDYKEIKQVLSVVKKRAELLDIRLTLHPDQFVIINSPTDSVNIKSTQELEYQGYLAELVGADVINIHGGGGYGDKKSALNRFAKNFDLLSSRVKKRLTVENDDKIYTPNDLLPLCKKLGIPLVYDVHHHRCNQDTLSVSDATNLALKTWNREPLFHISSPKEGWDGNKPSRHADYIDITDLPDCWKGITKLTVEIEAKEKELAILKLQKKMEDVSWGGS